MFPFLFVNLWRYDRGCREATCEVLSETPLGEKGYTPQGMTWARDGIIFANTWKNQRSRVYLLDPESLSERAWFDMPAGAVHTSGLCTIGDSLWGVDYKANKAYKIDYRASFDCGSCVLLGAFDTALKGTSAACAVEYGGRMLLAISDFMHSRRVIFVEPDACLDAGTASGNVLHYYVNGGFSQGLEWDGTYLYESENRLPRAVLNRIDLSRVLDTHRWRDGLVAQYRLPEKGIEDLAYDGRRLWSSDEVLFRFLTIEIP